MKGQKEHMLVLGGLERVTEVYLNIVSEIKLLANNDRVCNFVKVDRSEVRVSHCLANFVRTERRTFVWLGSGPDVVLQELERELFVTVTPSS